MRVLLDEPQVFVTYRTASVYCEDAELDVDAVWRGQRNGLCGAAVAGWLQMITGTHTGGVPFRVESHEAEPPLDDAGEEIVEVSFTASGARVHLAELDASESYLLALPAGDFRVRYQVNGLDDREHTEERADACLLQFWPAPPEPDRIVRQTSTEAAYWHRAHSRLKSGTKSHKADNSPRRTRTAKPRTAPSQERRPSPPLRAAMRWANPLIEMDRDLTLDLGDADGETVRSVAVWAAERAADVAGLGVLPWTGAALAAVKAGDPPPPPFTPRRRDQRGVWDLLDDPAIQLTTVVLPRLLPEEPVMEMSQQHVAMPALFAAAAANPLVGAINAVYAAACAHGTDHYRSFLAELRVRFPSLGPVVSEAPGR
ncbi:hypothetical protein FB565_008915 [Actinoplanes lutulentus]|uniref:Uncharacterized protein n=1 Tax=Actinoplanes lutulentus TaxID=1287878 RepID=A0A327Z521_9ACTN|nr:hypothetical protein [Actinoplanes lutulentus]MBB2949110.1 hypothetical protein [Actinoplanes lutulentus]RAK31431.1 hypothetical protein B0I29_115238 [Actinoplanes lutulentus]